MAVCFTSPRSLTRITSLSPARHGLEASSSSTPPYREGRDNMAEEEHEVCPTPWRREGVGQSGRQRDCGKEVMERRRDPRRPNASQGASVKEILIEACRRNNTDLLAETIAGIKDEAELSKLLNETTTVMGNHLYHEAASLGNCTCVLPILSLSSSSRLPFAVSATIPTRTNTPSPPLPPTQTR